MGEKYRANTAIETFRILKYNTSSVVLLRSTMIASNDRDAADGFFFLLKALQPLAT